jgi:hypothetical protein
MVCKGFLLISDLSGYTQFLTQSELEHAHAILKELTREQLHEMRLPFRVSNFQGDAILAYVRRGDIIQGQTLVDTVDGIYARFAEARDLIHRNTTCNCTACRKTPSLDLKIFVHEGTFIAERVGDHEELSGPDVILAHRLLKNSVQQKTGIRAYAAFTAAALDAMDLPAWRAGLVSHQETYEHVGTVDVGTHDLRRAWESNRALRQVVVEPGADVLTFRARLPVPPSVAWDLVNEPNCRRDWLGLDSVARDTHGGARIGLGAEFHCSHSIGEFSHRVVGWRPFEFVTLDSVSFNGIPYLETYRLTPEDDSVRLDVLVRVTPPSNLLARLAQRERRKHLIQVAHMAMGHGMEVLEGMAARHRDAGKAEGRI